MKKLVFACCAVLAVGCCMMAGGWAAGGRLYSSYYNGALHPVTESLHDMSNFLSRRLYYHTWGLDDSWHSGWFADDFSDRVKDVVNQKVNTALDGLKTSGSGSQPGTLPPFSLPKASLDNIRQLELTCKSGTGSNFTIESGVDYGLEGDFSIVTNEFDHEKWELEITCNGDEVTLILPESNPNYDDIEITSRLDASIDIAVPLRASKIDLYAESGSIDADLLSAREMELSVSSGLLYAYLDGNAQNYHMEANSNYGSATLNGEELVGPNSGVLRYDNRKSVNNPINELEIRVNGGGTAELYTIE